jgi:hypothetical protein
MVPPLAEVPAICDNCGAIFRSGIVFGPGSSANMVGNKAGPCPVCGAMGTIPDGFYEFVGDTLTIVSRWSPERRRRFAGELEKARGSGNRSAAEAVVRKQPDLLPVAQRLLIPRNAGEFWAFIAALLTAIALLGSQSGGNVTVNERTVIEKVTSKPKPSKPEASTTRSERPPPSADQKAKSKAQRKARAKTRRQQRRK